MEDESIFFINGRQPQTIMQPKTIKSKNIGCGTAPGNLVVHYKIYLIILCKPLHVQCPVAIVIV